MISRLLYIIFERQAKVEELSRGVSQRQTKVEELSRCVLAMAAKVAELSGIILDLENHRKKCNSQLIRAETIMAFMQSSLSSTVEAFRRDRNLGDPTTPNPPQMVGENNKTGGNPGPDFVSDENRATEQKQMVTAQLTQTAIIGQTGAETFEQAKMVENDREDGDVSSKSFWTVGPPKENYKKADSWKRRIKKNLDDENSLNQPKKKRAKKSMRVMQTEAGELGANFDTGHTFEKATQCNSHKTVSSGKDLFVVGKGTAVNHPKDINKLAEQVTRGRESDQSKQLSQFWTAYKCPRIKESFSGKERTKEEQMVDKEAHQTSKSLINMDEDPLSRGNPLAECPPKYSNSTNSSQKEKEIFELACPVCNMLFRSCNRLATLKCLQLHQAGQHGPFAKDISKDSHDANSDTESGCKSIQQIEHKRPKDCSKPCQICNGAREETQKVSENKILVEQDGPEKLVRAASLSRLLTESDELKKLFG